MNVAIQTTCTHIVSHVLRHTGELGRPRGVTAGPGDSVTEGRDAPATPQPPPTHALLSPQTRVTHSCCPRAGPAPERTARWWHRLAQAGHRLRTTLQPPQASTSTLGYCQPEPSHTTETHQQGHPGELHTARPAGTKPFLEAPRYPESHALSGHVTDTHGSPHETQKPLSGCSVLPWLPVHGDPMRGHGVQSWGLGCSILPINAWDFFPFASAPQGPG